MDGADPSAISLPRIPIALFKDTAHIAGSSLISERAASAGGAIGVAALILAAMARWLSGPLAADAAQPRVGANRAITLITPTASVGVRPEQRAQGGRTAAAPQRVVQGVSAIDVSTQNDASVLEWSVSTIAAPPTATPAPERGTGGTGQGIGLAQGAAEGGNGVYDPYAGASPDYRQRSAQNGPGGGVMPPQVLAALRARAQGMSGQFRCQAVSVPTRRIACVRQSGALDAAVVERWIGELWPAAPAVVFTVSL